MESTSYRNKIKILRIQHGLTLEQVAQAVGVGKSTVRKWETGIIKNMKQDKILALANTLHTTPEYLMDWKDSSDEPITLGERIKIARIQKGLSQDDIAKAIGSTRQAIYKYEAGIVTNIPMDKLEMIAPVEEERRPKPVAG